MWVRHDEHEAENAAPAKARRGKKRRGATSMEYVVMASFILMVVIGAVQYFGFSVSNLFTSDAAATSQAQQNALNHGP